MKRSMWLGISVGLVATIGGSSVLSAQTLLNRLEQRLSEVLPSGAPLAIAPVVRASAEFEPGYLGIVADDSTGRVTIASLRAGSPADRAGLKTGDELIAVNGRIIKSVDEFAATVEPFPAGARLNVEIRRDGKRQRIAVVLTDRVPTRGVEPRERQAAAFLVERPTLGVRVGAVTEDARREYGITTKRGALVVEVTPGGSLDKAGIGLGAAIVAVDGRRIDSPQDLSEFVRTARVGQEIELTYYEGEQLRRKRMRVGTADDTNPAGEAEGLPAVRGFAAPERGPAIKRLERAIEGLARPAGVPPPAPEPGLPAFEADADLRVEVVALRAELADVRRRLAELERRMEVRKPRPADPDVDDPDDDRPKLLEPDRLTPRGEPKLKLREPKLEAPANDPFDPPAKEKPGTAPP